VAATLAPLLVIALAKCSSQNEMSTVNEQLIKQFHCRHEKVELSILILYLINYGIQFDVFQRKRIFFQYCICTVSNSVL
jgi:hypothetical protein